MPDVNLSSLSGTELRRLLDTTRARGQASLSYKVLQEMADRRERGGRRRARQPTDPRIVAIDLSDPLEAEDEPPPLAAEAAAPPEPPAAETEPEAPPEIDPETEEAAPLYLETAPPARAARPARPTKPARRPIRWPRAGFLAGIAVGAALGWGADEMIRERQLAEVAASATPSRPDAALTAQAAPPTVAAAPLATLAAADAPPPAAASTDPGVASAPATAPDSPPPPPPPEVASATPQATPQTAAPAPALPAETPAAEVASEEPAARCARAATPADRTICGDPQLQKLQRELREAYAEALDAHQDRALLREHQLAWREARNAVADPDRLTQLYMARIRTLKSATAEARRAR
jgi:uncharacterized protein YecT (DUF1311 family)